MLCCIAGLGLGSIASFFAWKWPSARTVIIGLLVLITAALSWHLSTAAESDQSHTHFAASFERQFA